MPEFARLVDEAADTTEQAAGHRLSLSRSNRCRGIITRARHWSNRQLTRGSPFLDNELVALAYRAPREPGEQPTAAAEIDGEGNPAAGVIPTDRAYRRAAMTLFSGMAKGAGIYGEAEYAYDYGMPARLGAYRSRDLQAAGGAPISRAP